MEYHTPVGFFQIRALIFGGLVRIKSALRPLSVAAVATACSLFTPSAQALSVTTGGTFYANPMAGMVAGDTSIVTDGGSPTFVTGYGPLTNAFGW
jgi:hypothetical protein